MTCVRKQPNIAYRIQVCRACHTIRRKYGSRKLVYKSANVQHRFTNPQLILPSLKRLRFAVGICTPSLFWLLLLGWRVRMSSMLRHNACEAAIKFVQASFSWSTESLLEFISGEKRGKTKKRIVKTLFRIDRMAQRVRAKSRASSHQPKLIQKKAQHMLHEDQVSRVLLEDACYQRNINICFYIVFLGKLFIITPMRKQCSISDDGRIWSYRWYRIPVL